MKLAALLLIVTAALGQSANKEAKRAVTRLHREAQWDMQACRCSARGAAKARAATMKRLGTEGSNGIH